jgi:23S rRNA (guanosine2251-2'-O)-methyltransferase
MKNTKEQVYIYGTHAINEALERSPEAVRHIYFVEKRDEKMLERIQKLDIPFDNCDADHLPRGVERDANHQGYIALINPKKILQDYKPFINNLEVTDDTGIVVLNELTDPHNVGAIIRSAAAFGMAGVLIPEHRQAPITGAVVKVSAGMAFALPIVSIVNVNTVLRDLKDKGFWIYGLTGEGDTSIQKEQFTKPSVFVLGNEERGIREKTEETCDFRLSIPIQKDVESLNVAASAAVTFYAWKSQRGDVE